MRPNIGKAILGGFVGTLLITMTAYWVAPMTMGEPMDIAAMVAAILGVSWGMGMLVHFINGTVIFPILYTYVAYPTLAGSPAVRGLLWGVVLWLMAQIFFNPVAGMGLFAAEGLGTPAVIGSLIGHVLYGLFQGIIAGRTRVEMAHPGHARPA